MGVGVFQQREPKMPGAHKICTAIFGARIAGGKITDMRLFLIFVLKFVRSRVLGRDFFNRFQVLSDRKVHIQHKKWPLIAVSYNYNSR